MSDENLTRIVSTISRKQLAFESGGSQGSGVWRAVSAASFRHTNLKNFYNNVSEPKSCDTSEEFRVRQKTVLTHKSYILP